MALRDSWVPIRFERGVDSTTNKKVMISGTLTECENGSFGERITIIKRNGTELFSRAWAVSSGYDGIEGAVGLASRDDGNDLVILTDDDRIGSYDSDSDHWVERGHWPMLRLKTDEPPRGPNEGWDATQCSSGSVQLWAWEDLRGGVFARLRNLDTGVSYGPEFRIGGHLSRSPSAVTVGQTFHVYFVSGSVNTMNVAVLNPSNPTSVSASYSQLHPAIDPLNRTYSVDTLEGWSTSRIAISLSGSTIIGVVREDGVLAASGSSLWPNPVSFDSSIINPDVSLSPDGALMAVTVKGPTGVSGSIRTRVYDPISFSIVQSSITMDSHPTVTGSSSSVLNIGGAFSGRSFSVISSMSASQPVDRYLRIGSVDMTSQPYDVPSSGVLIRHSQLSSKPFMLGDHVHAWCTHPSTRQSTDFLVRDDGLVEAMSRYSRAHPPASGVLGRVEVKVSPGDVGGVVARRGSTVRDQFIAVSGGLSSFGDRHPSLSSLTYHPSSSWRPVDIAGNLYMPGGFLGKYDGSSVTENNFLLMVEGLSGSVGSGSLGSPGILSMGDVRTAGPLATASFVYEVYPVAYDAHGNEEQGGCVQLLSLTLSGSVTQVQNSASLSWNSICHTKRDGVQASDIRFKVFRTGLLNGVPGTTRQRIDDPARPIINSTSVDRITFTDTIPENVRALGEISYTQFSPVNGPTVACSSMTSQADRLYVAGSEGRPLDIVPSKLRLDGPISFADAVSFQAPSDGGPITGLGALDGRIVVFKRNRVFVGNASGPDNSLTDVTPFDLPELITTDVGSQEPATVVSVAGNAVQGLLFRSNRGMRAITPGLSIVDMSDPLGKLDSFHVVGGLSPDHIEEARFYTSEGTTLVLNTKFNEWSTATDQSAVAATTWKGVAAHVDHNGYVRVESTGSWLDSSRAYPLKIETGWLPLDGIQGLSRVRRLLVLGDFYSHHKLRVEMAVDYRDSWVAIREIDTRTSMQIFPYGGPQNPSTPTGSVDTYGSGSFGGRDRVYQFEFRLPIERFQTVRFRFSDVDQALSGSNQNGRSYSLTEMRLLVAKDSRRPNNMATRKVKG